MTCRDMARLASEELDGPLAPLAWLRLRLHLLLCTPCAHFRRQLRLLRDAALRYAAGPDGAAPLARERLSPGARERIERSLRDGDL